MTNQIPFWERKKKFFNEEKQQYNSAESDLKKQTNRYGTIRVLFFIAAVSAIIYFINERNGLLTALLLLITPIIFGWLVNKHNYFKRRLSLNRIKASILDDEIMRLAIDLADLDEGDEFVDHQHPYTTDMDVFGKHSLFALINRGKLTFGRITLAEWFRTAAAVDIIKERQEAIAELKTDYAWQLNYWSENHLYQPKKKTDADRIFDWFENENIKAKPWYLSIGWFGLIQFWTLAILSILGIIPAVLLGISFFINLLLLLPVQRAFLATQKETEPLVAILNQHKGLFKLITDRSFSNSYLNAIKQQFEQPDATQKIKSLNKSLNWMHSRNGMMYWLINPFALTDYWVLHSSLKWKENYGRFVRKWFNKLGDFEALLSLSTFSFVHEDYIIPSYEADEVKLKGEAIGHPLIKHEERVSNDFSMVGKGALTLITGANMSGKSTFERSLGVNIILAQMGAVCCAENLTLSPMQLFTSMRTQDDLSENTSSFYAELKRLKQLVELTETFSVRPIFYLLDEILKGTNSEDRNKGAESLIRQLKKTNSMGLISTHDLTLATLENELDKFSNFSFNSQVEGDQILFDYKLHNGACSTFNAVPLMKKMGIEIV